MGAFWWWPSGDVPEVSSQQLHLLLTGRASAPQVLDVRTVFEWSESRIAGSVNVPVTELKSRLQSLKLDKARPVVAICGHAIRSIPAVRLLREDGFRDVCQLQGGMAAWNEAGLPVVEGPSAPMERANQPAPDMKVTLSDGTSTWLNSFWKLLFLVVIRGEAEKHKKAADNQAFRYHEPGQIYLDGYLLLFTDQLARSVIYECVNVFSVRPQPCASRLPATIERGCRGEQRVKNEDQPYI